MLKVSLLPNIRTLLEVAILVDKYQFHDVMTFVSILWIDRLRDTSANTRAKAFVEWICISWVFGAPLQFEESTKVAIRKIDRPFERYCGESLPIPSIIAGMSQCVPLQFTRC